MGKFTKDIENLDAFALNEVEKARILDKTNKKEEKGYSDVITLFEDVFTTMKTKIKDKKFMRSDISYKIFAQCTLLVSHRVVPSKEYEILRKIQKWIRKFLNTYDFRPTIIERLIDSYNEQWIHCYHFKEMINSFNKDYLILEGLVTETKAISEINDQIDGYLYKIHDASEKKEKKEVKTKEIDI